MPPMPGGGPIPGGMPALIPGGGTMPIGAMPCIGGGLIPIGGLMPGGGPIMPCRGSGMVKSLRLSSEEQLSNKRLTYKANLFITPNEKKLFEKTKARAQK